MEIFSYLFSPIPGSTFNYYLYVLIYGAILIGIGVLFRILFVVKKQNKALKKTYQTAPGQFVWIGLILIILAASRVSGIPYLGMRLFLIIAIGFSIYFIVKNILFYFKKYPEFKKVVAPKEKAKTKQHNYTTSKN